MVRVKAGEYNSGARKKPGNANVKPRLLLVLILLLATPLGVAGWLGYRIAAEEQAVVRAQYAVALQEPLRSAEVAIRGAVSRCEQELKGLGPFSAKTPEMLRGLARSSGIVRQCFRVDAAYDVIYPAPSGSLLPEEAAFIDTSSGFSEWRALALAALKDTFRPRSSSNAGTGPGNGWFTWNEGARQHFLYSWREADGTISGAEVNWARLAADIIAVLPHTGANAASATENCVILVNAHGEDLYRWGSYDPPQEEQPAVFLPLSQPLTAWRLEHFVPPSRSLASLGRGVRFNVLSGLFAVFAGTVALAIYFYRESGREMREARQRVSFVNQVSHELKTPLTNIRMYAELLQEQCEEEDTPAQKHVHVIVSESQRLSRLIENVLTFARRERGTLRLHMTEDSVDTAVAEIVEQFRESAGRQPVAIQFKAGAPGRYVFDRDAVQQVVANLLSNAEKYAKGATVIQVNTWTMDGRILVSVADNGPGIPEGERGRIFSPFYRIDNALTQGVAGTGIGLAIARDLARRHGGDLILQESPAGAVFVFSFLAETTPEKE